MNVNCAGKTMLAVPPPLRGAHFFAVSNSDHTQPQEWPRRVHELSSSHVTISSHSITPDKMSRWPSAHIHAPYKDRAGAMVSGAAARSSEVSFKVLLLESSSDGENSSPKSFAKRRGATGAWPAQRLKAQMNSQCPCEASSGSRRAPLFCFP